MSKSVKQILSNLQNAIEALKKGGEDNNNKIDTKKERNQLAKLLAGAEQEIGDLIEFETNKLDNQKLTKAQRDEKAMILGNEYDEAKAKINKVKSSLIETAPTTEEYNFENNSFQNIPNLKHLYPNGGYDVKKYDLKNTSGYGATIYDKNGKRIGLRAYKNDKTVYANSEFAAKQLGLLSSKDQTGLFKGVVKTMFALPTFGNSLKGDLTPILQDLKDDEYYDANSNSIYKWNKETNSFSFLKEGDLSKVLLSQPFIDIDVLEELNVSRYKTERGKNKDNVNLDKAVDNLTAEE